MTQTKAVTFKATLDNVLPFYAAKAAQGQRVCLVTQFKSDGASPRPVGSQIAVSEDGENFGFITGGCAESAIVHEALIAIRERQSRMIRIGSDSPWFDIKLPCGAGIDIHFSVA
ncbi:MAG: XdhC family protein, partial [Planctomycetota bacterium]